MKRPARHPSSHHAPAKPLPDYHAEGRDACRAGKPVNACPHPSGYSAERDWIAGWVAELLATPNAPLIAPERKETAA